MLSHSSEAYGFHLAHNIYVAFFFNVLRGEFGFDHDAGKDMQSSWSVL